MPVIFKDSRGEKNRRAILNDAIVRDIRRRHEAGEKIAAIARVHGICRQHCWQICHYQRWAHVT